MKSLYKTVFIVYLLALLWIVLFKASYDLSAVLLDYQTRSLNLIPFADVPEGSLKEAISNFVVFIPFGLLLGVNFKRASIWQKLGLVCAFSFAAEATQYVLAIGVADITDIITNTLGGLLGLMLYGLCSKCIAPKKLDRFIIMASIVLFAVLVLLRILVLKVNY